MTEETVRESFERYWRKSRGEKKHRDRLDLGLREDGTYVDDSVQRHWWTWQTAHRRALASVAKQCGYEGAGACLAGCTESPCLRETDKS